MYAGRRVPRLAEDAVAARRLCCFRSDEGGAADVERVSPAVPRAPVVQLTKANCQSKLLLNVLLVIAVSSPVRFWMNTPFSPDSLPAF